MVAVVTNFIAAPMQSTLIKKNPCSCLELPCTHNPEIPEEIAEDIVIHGYKTKKGIKIAFLDKTKFLILEETNQTMKVQVLE